MSAPYNKACCVCGKTTTQRCSACAQAGSDTGIVLAFCSTEHQKIVWPVHKLVCGPGKAHPFTPPDLSDAEIAVLASSLDCPIPQPGVHYSDAGTSGGSAVPMPTLRSRLEHELKLPKGQFRQLLSNSRHFLNCMPSHARSFTVMAVRSTLFAAFTTAYDQGKPFPELSEFCICALFDHAIRPLLDASASNIEDLARHRALVLFAAANAVRAGRSRPSPSITLDLISLCAVAEDWCRLLFPYVPALSRFQFFTLLPNLLYPIRQAFPRWIIEIIVDWTALSGDFATVTAWTAHKWVCGPGKANPFTPPPISAEEVGALARAIDHVLSLKGYASLETKLRIKYGRPLPVAEGLDQLCRKISKPSLERYRFAVQRWLEGSLAAELTIRLHLYEAVTQIQRVGTRSTRFDPSWYAAHIQEKLELSSPYFQLDGASSQILHRAFIASALLPDPDVRYTDWKLLPLGFTAVSPAWISLQRMLLPYLRFPDVQHAADDLRLLLLPLERSFPGLHIEPRFNFDEQTGKVADYQIEASLR